MCTATDLERACTPAARPHAAHLRRRWSAQQRDELELVLAWRGSIPAGRMSLLAASKYAAVRDRYPHLREVNDLEATPTGTGTGRALLQWAHEHLAARGVPMHGLGVAHDNPRAEGLYARLGYERTDLDLIDEWTEYGPDGDAIAEHRDPIGYLIRPLRDSA